MDKSPISFWWCYLQDCYSEWSRLSDLLDKEMMEVAPAVYTSKHDDPSAFDVWINHTDYEWVRCYFAGTSTQAIGMVTLAQGKEDGHILEMYVLPEYRNGGIGSMLFSEALASLHGKIRLGTPAGNERVLKFYKKHGFMIESYNLVYRN